MIIVGRGRSKATQRKEITDPTVSREHCWLTDNGDGTFTLLNKSQQGTFVDGRQILKTIVTPDTYIKLSDTTTVKVADLLPVTLHSQASVPEFSIKHLKAVWNEYHYKQLQIQKNQRSINLLRSASPMFTLGSGTIATLAKTMGWGSAILGLTLVMTVIGFGLMAYSFVMGLKDHGIEEREKATNKFNQTYVCPNPKCKHFLGNQSYSLLRQNKNCPWCKCKFVE